MNHVSPATDIFADEDAARSDRNAERLRDLAAARKMTMEMMARLSDGAAVRLMGTQANAYDEVKDPYLTMSRLQLGLCRIVALEQRLDESDEMRARRLADEDAERQAAAQRAADAAVRAEREAASDIARQTQTPNRRLSAKPCARPLSTWTPRCPSRNARA